MDCPVCQASKSEPLLKLNASPIYQHPIPAYAEVPEPYSVDLTYVYCAACGHAYQQDFNAALMDRIYQSYYYTPAPEGVGATFRTEFVEFLREEMVNLPKGSGILEIGSSSGELMVQLRELRPDCRTLGFEPSEITARRAQENGVPTVCRFFNQQTAVELEEKFSCIISRHVIEHLTDFHDFFSAVTEVCASPETLLVLETPSLDAHWQAVSIAPFHVEHAHVFSIHSLALLASHHGWYLVAFRVTESQNLIAMFSRDPVREIAVNLPQARSSYDHYFESFRARMQALIRNKKIILWGAGSGGVKLVKYHHLVVAHLVDGNREKKGMRFLGMDTPIEYAPECIRAIQQRGVERDYTVLIGSGFYREISQQLQALQWQGEIIAPYAPDFLQEFPL